ncbi:uncharacterized protein LOC132947516, partial [Metopolophium dirhodum]|uniref:uncharacterized protein LOC132947516 n=1 Tax=Metopolophium dirhodum TaxID=44670 RepID=UPI0029902E15
MDIWNENNHVYNIRLAKLSGVFQLLNTASIKFLGRNVYHILMTIIMLFVCAVAMVLIVSSPYYWSDDILVGVDYGWKGIAALYLSFKVWNIVYHSDDIWDCLTVTRYDFTSQSLRNRHILDHWRERSVWITNKIAIMYLMALVFFACNSLLFCDDISTVKNHDGSVGNYRQNIFNLYLIVTDETYNAHYYTFYFVELFFVVCLVMLSFVFDFLLATLCLAVSCQLQMIKASFASVGYKSLSDPHTPIIGNKDERKNLSNEHDLIYDEIISIIKDHQAVMKKYYELLIIFKRLMLLQVFYSSISLIVIWVIFIMIFKTEDKFIASEVTTVKMICAIPTISYQLIIVCYLFDNLHKQKDSIIFALYSSNWTEMNMKCKKLVLLTMKINNANQKKLKFTRTKIVNLELFYNVST